MSFNFEVPSSKSIDELNFGESVFALLLAHSRCDALVTGDRMRQYDHGFDGMANRSVPTTPDAQSGINPKFKKLITVHECLGRSRSSS